MRKRFTLLLTLFIGFAFHLMAENVKISEIAENPGAHNNSFVEIEGVVTQYTPKTQESTAFYLVKGDFGGLLQVNTNSERPEVNKRYKIEGTVVIDGRGMAYVVEKNRAIVSGINMQYLIYAGLGLLVCILVVVVLIFAKKQKKSNRVESVNNNINEVNLPNNQMNQNGSDDFKTIRVNLNEAPKTMRLMPGLLEISAGPDMGKQFYISGIPTPYGNVVTIGREEVSGDKKYAHIQLLDQSVSRKQAEIISVGEKTFVKNLSQVNHTMLDGNRLDSNEMKEVEVGSIIKVGAIEFTYKLN